MKENKKHIINSLFLDLFFKNKCFPPFYKKITNSFLNSIVYESDAKTTSKFSNLTYAISDIPSYFIAEFNKSYKHLKLLKTPLYLGFLINLSVFKNLEDYLNNHLGRPRKSQLKRYRKRLDKCISPQYKIFYGDISKEEYNFTFKKLIELTQRRFTQKEELNFELPYLELYQEIMYPMILDKKASIFIIYHDKKPINITLNFIEDATIFHWNSCYDIDYQMFNLGHINMVNHLEWAFNNGFKLFDMGRGDFLHKRKYVNESYMYYEHIVYNSKSIIAYISAKSKLLKLKLRFALIKLLKKTNLHLLYGRYAKYKYKFAKSRNNKNNEVKISTDTISEIPKLETLTLIDLTIGKYDFLIKPLNYFLHKSQDNVSQVKVYMDKKNSQVFYFEGTKKQQKLSIENQKGLL
ncbi:GNAT family N-acetyltransferase [Sabulilitoribacter arenilitoris]|uniref:GNAT family N-acetyltransferase n=1 Tax=Wocania arenilitoris TaxID=2044858 RepID=A0AAE3ER22_9FLAO|nr:GNAT family N-acetyltransferase [Wocania arenilitoris]MCF7568634.1 GNAT family N-acetyltransferase [Wocania arenilitoris]